jgi:hypothetical protein
MTSAVARTKTMTLVLIVNGWWSARYSPGAAQRGGYAYPKNFWRAVKAYTDKSG